MAIVDGADRFQRRHAWLGFPVAVVYKFFDDFGTYLAAILTYYAFVSLFPLLLIASTVLSVVLRGDQHLQHELLTSALKSFPVIGEELGQAEAPQRRPGRPDHRHHRLGVRRARGGPGVPVRQQHHVGRAARQPPEPARGPGAGAWSCWPRRGWASWPRPRCRS